MLCAECEREWTNIILTNIYELLITERKSIFLAISWLSETILNIILDISKMYDWFYKLIIIQAIN